jgi:hypothetical protein
VHFLSFLQNSLLRDSSSSVDQFGFKRLAGLQLTDSFDCES